MQIAWAICYRRFVTAEAALLIPRTPKMEVPTDRQVEA